MIIMFIADGMDLSFYIFNVLPRASYGHIECGFVPSTIWRFSNIFFSCRWRKLALNREDFLHLGIGIILLGQVGGGLEGHWQLCASIYLSDKNLCLDVCSLHLYH